MANGYKKIRFLGSDVHIYEFNQRKEEPRIEFGKPGVLELLSRMGSPKPWEVVTAKINWGLFYQGQDGIVENLYTWAPNAITVAYGKDTVMKCYKGDYSKDRKEFILKDSLWVAGSSYALIERGVKTLYGAKYFDHSIQRHPRTIFGQRQNLNILLVVVQGRTLFNRGMTAAEEAQLCQYLGMWNAVNLDGGGSSEMIVNGKIMNKPTDGHERSIGSAICIYKKV